MKCRALTVVLLVLMLTMTALGSAQASPDKLIVSYKDLGVYESKMMTIVGDDWMFHAEDSTSLDYELALFEKEMVGSVRLGLRVDDAPVDFWVRPYLAFLDRVAGVKVKARWLVGGIKGAPQRFDLWTSCPVNDWLSIEGWELIPHGGTPEHWYGPKVRHEDFSIWYAKNLNNAGDDAVIMSWSRSF